VLPISNLDWFTTASEKAAYVAGVSTATGADGSPQQRSDPGSATTAAFGGRRVVNVSFRDGCRVPQVVKEHRSARLKGGRIMNADDLKKLT